MSDEQITDVALSLEYVKEYAKKHTSLSNTQVYLLEQCVVQRRLSVHLGWGYNNVRAAYDEVSEKIQSEVYANAKEFVNKNKDRYECGGYIYTGEGQDLGQFWANWMLATQLSRKHQQTLPSQKITTVILWQVRPTESILIKIASTLLLPLPLIRTGTLTSWKSKQVLIM